MLSFTPTPRKVVTQNFCVTPVVSGSVPHYIINPCTTPPPGYEIPTPTPTPTPAPSDIIVTGIVHNIPSGITSVAFVEAVTFDAQHSKLGQPNVMASSENGGYSLVIREDARSIGLNGFFRYPRLESEPWWVPFREAMTLQYTAYDVNPGGNIS